MKKIDIHVHSNLVKVPHERMGPGRGTEKYPNTSFTDPGELRAMYDKLGVEFGVNLPLVSPEFQAIALSNEEAQAVADNYPETYVWFCNLDPRGFGHKDDADLSYFIEYFKARGAKGIGEITANIPFDHPLVFNLFKHAEKCGMPVLFHIGYPGGGDYGLVDEIGLPRLEKALAAFPNLKFLGHSQKFWAEISGDVTEKSRGGYPKGPVKDGRLEILFDKYPNLCGDLSAGSGENAVRRDEAYGCYFMEKYQDRLFFGTDICDPVNDMRLSFWMDDMLAAGKISQTAYEKIGRKNALKLLKMD